MYSERRVQGKTHDSRTEHSHPQSSETKHTRRADMSFEVDLPCIVSMDVHQVLAHLAQQGTKFPCVTSYIARRHWVKNDFTGSLMEMRFL